MPDTKSDEPKDFKAIMLSSTFNDLKEHRARVIEAIQKLGYAPRVMEFSGAQAEADVIDTSLAMVRDAFAYVCVISHRYGQILVDPERNPDRLSLTELEFNEAARLGRRILLFIMSDEHPVMQAGIEADPEKLKKLDAFRERAKQVNDGSKVNREYATFDDLAQFSTVVDKGIRNLVGYSQEAVTTKSELPPLRELSLNQLNELRRGAEASPAGLRSPPGRELVSIGRSPLDDGAFELRSSRPSSGSPPPPPPPPSPASFPSSRAPPPDDDVQISPASPSDSARPPAPSSKWVNSRVAGWALLVASMTALTGFWFSSEFAHVVAALAKGITSVATSLLELVRSAATPSPSWRPRTSSADVVDASAFSPEECAPGETILVQIFFHRRSRASAARKRAQESDRQATRRSVCTFETAVKRGQRLGVKLESQDFSIDASEQSVVWRGELCACPFSVTLSREPTGRSGQISANFFLDGVPIGILKFSVTVASPARDSRARVQLCGDSSRHFEYAFLSYSSRDRLEVLQCAQVLEGVGINFFLDAVSLRSGEIWQRRLFEEIDRSDMFMLFWSKNAEEAESKWIEREVTYALKRQVTSKDQLPCFRSTFLGGDKPTRPAWLPGHIQFDNALRRHLLAARHDQDDQ